MNDAICPSRQSLPIASALLSDRLHSSPKSIALKNFRWRLDCRQSPGHRRYQKMEHRGMFQSGSHHRRQTMTGHGRHCLCRAVSKCLQHWFPLLVPSPTGRNQPQQVCVSLAVAQNRLSLQRLYSLHQRRLLRLILFLQRPYKQRRRKRKSSSAATNQNITIYKLESTLVPSNQYSSLTPS